jgi:hypothetical protein
MPITKSAGSEGRGWRSPVRVKPQRSYRRRAAALVSVTPRCKTPKPRCRAQSAVASTSASPTFWPRAAGLTHMDTTPGLRLPASSSPSM